MIHDDKWIPRSTQNHNKFNPALNSFCLPDILLCFVKLCDHIITEQDAERLHVHPAPYFWVRQSSQWGVFMSSSWRNIPVYMLISILRINQRRHGVDGRASCSGSFLAEPVPGKDKVFFCSSFLSSRIIFWLFYKAIQWQHLNMRKCRVEACSAS